MSKLLVLRGLSAGGVNLSYETERPDLILEWVQGSGEPSEELLRFLADVTSGCGTTASTPDMVRRSLTGAATSDERARTISEWLMFLSLKELDRLVERAREDLVFLDYEVS